MVVPLTLENDNTFVSTYAFLDTGSTCSYLLSNIATSLNCTVKEPAVKLEIGGFHESKTLETKRVSLTVHPFGNIAESFKLNQVFVLPSFNLADVDTHSLKKTHISTEVTFRSYCITRLDLSWDKIISIL